MDIKDLKNPWRNILQTPAKWRGVVFHVETGSRMSGRRTVTHEYPKANFPYSEDMGRHAIRLHFSGYIIYRPNNPIYEYVSQRRRMVIALDQDGPGILIHPVFAPGGLQMMCERYTMVENRRRGGFTEFEMMFVEYGFAGNSVERRNSRSYVDKSASAAESSAKSAYENAVAGVLV